LERRLIFIMEMHCPRCSSEHPYEDGGLWVCPECGHEWSAHAPAEQAAEDEQSVVRDANGTVLADGDSVTVIKDLKIKGASQVIKGGTKVRGIRLVDGGGGHNIACRIAGLGDMNLKSEFVKKA
jgi:protein PhnA